MAKKIKKGNKKVLKKTDEKNIKKKNENISLNKEKNKPNSIPKKNTSNVESFKRHHIWGGIGIIVGIVLTILVISIFSFKYINYIEQESYIKGSQDIVELIYNTIEENGGAVLNIGGKEVTIAKYEKPIITKDTER